MLRLHIVIFAALLAFTMSSPAEQIPPDWRTFGHAEGLAEDTASAVSVSSQGQITVAHSSGRLSRYNGYTVETLTGPPTSHGKILESRGGQLWSITTNGLYEYRDDVWLLHGLNELRLKSSQTLPLDTPLLPIRQGRVLVLLTNKLLLFLCGPAERPHVEALLESTQTHVGTFTGLLESRENGVWVSGELGLLNFSGPLGTLKRSAPWREHVPTNLPALQNLRKPHLTGSGTITLTANSPDQKSAVVRFDGQNWSLLKNTDEPLTDAWEDDLGTVWGVARHRLLRWDPVESRFNAPEFTPPQQCLDIATEPTGVFWIASTLGLHRHAASLWSQSSFARTRAPISSAASDDSGKIWFISDHALHVITENGQESIPLPGSGESSDSSVRLFPLRGSNLVLVLNERLITVDSNSRKIVRHTALEAGSIIAGLADGKLLLQRNELGAESVHYALYDGDKFSNFSAPLPTQEVGPITSCALTARNGDLWIGAQRGTILLRLDKPKTFPSVDKSAPADPVSFAELPDETIWAAASDRVWKFDGERWMEARRGFDRITTLHGSKDGSLWVATRNGLYRYIHGAWLQNHTQDGLPSAIVTGLCEDSADRLWAATASGLAQFRPSADPDPPHSFLRPTFTESTVHEGTLVRFVVAGVDSWNLTPSSNLLFSCRVDISEWSPYQFMSERALPSLTAGKHILQVRSIDRNGNVDSSPASYEFSVILPWYREPRVLAIVAPASAIVLFFAWIALNRHIKLRHSYAEIEKRIAERTLELERANRELLHSQKMTALGTLSAGIAHDFNNILSIIEGSAQLIEENLDDPRKVHTRLSRIKAVVAQGSGIVKAMLGFSRESAPSAACDINSVVDDTLKLLGDRFLREVRITFEPAEALPLVNGSRDFIQQILLNFIFNAAEAMISDKAIVLRTYECSTQPPAPIVAATNASAYVCVSVQDFGSGIAPEVLPRIFEPFFTTKAMSSRRGTGLGLSMVYELAKKLGAGLSVETMVGKGTTFSVILPVHVANTESKNPQPRPVPEGEGTGIAKPEAPRKQPSKIQDSVTHK